MGTVKDSVDSEVDEPILNILSDFVLELRRAGLPVSLTENLDVLAAMEYVSLEEREILKHVLGATLIKNRSHWKTFEIIFEVYFSLRGPNHAIANGGVVESIEQHADRRSQNLGQGVGGRGGAQRILSAEELAESLFRALLTGDFVLLASLSRQAVTRYAGMEPGRPVGGTYYLYRTLRNLELDELLENLLDVSREEALQELTPLEERLERDEFTERIEQFKLEIEAEIRRRLVADRGVEAMTKTLRRPLPEDIDFMHASREELVDLRRAIYPLTRKLAARLVRKRRIGRKGSLDFRRTMRHSLSYGGVPVEPKFRLPRPAKPEIMVVADVSGSVAAFARFTLHLVYAISSQFSKVRSFVFIDGIDEVTRFFDGEEDIGKAIHRVNTEADVVWVDGHSDYGHALDVFWDRFGSDISSKTTVLILGDARNNYHSSQSWVLAEVQNKARKTYWLNPEPVAYWDTGDSIVGEYGAHCDGVYEVRNLRQLEKFVEKLA